MTLSFFITVIPDHDKPQPPGCLLEKISLEYITGKVNAIVSKLIQENQLKAYDDDVLKNLLNGWFMHIAIHAKNLKELADKKGQFIAIYRGFLLSLKDK